MLNQIFPTVPPYLLAAGVLHVAFFLALIIPSWRMFGRAGVGAPWALILLLPAIGLLAIPVALAASVLRRAGWARGWALMTLVPLLNVIFVWIFAFAHWPGMSRPRRARSEEADRPRVGGLEEKPAQPASAGAPRAPQPPVADRVAKPPPQEPAPAGLPHGAAAPENGEPLHLERASAVNRKRTEPMDDRTIRSGGNVQPDDQPPTRPAHRQAGRLWLLKGANERAGDISLRIAEVDLKEADDGLLVGRSSRADFIVTDDSVSRNHARLTLRGGKLHVEDLDSMNGTWVDGHRLEPGDPRPLVRDTEVEFGQMKLVVSEA